MAATIDFVYSQTQKRPRNGGGGQFFLHRL